MQFQNISLKNCISCNAHQNFYERMVDLTTIVLYQIELNVQFFQLTSKQRKTKGPLILREVKIRNS